MKEKITFSFGENWQNYVKNFLNRDRRKLAEESIKESLKIKDLKGKVFMDIGCGSGIFSLSAYRLGAKKVISFDVDPHSVECCKFLRSRESNPKIWEVYHGSVLDEKSLSKLPKADIVYSWGVLHHTGNMWKAIENAAGKVKDNGYFYITIYNKKTGLRGSKSQLKLKKIYNWLPYPLKKALEYAVIASYFFKNFAMLRNPFRLIREKEKSTLNRGMSYRVDVIDWLGGLPYEFARPQEIFDFCTKKLKLQLIDIYMVDERNLLGNNHYLFRKP